MKISPILLVDDDQQQYIENFMLDLEHYLELDSEIELEQDFENVLNKIDEMREGLKIIILDIMARKYNTIYGKSTNQGFNSGLVLLDAIEEKLLIENRRNQISIIVRSARQDLNENYFEGRDVKFFRRDQNIEIREYIKVVLNKNNKK